MNTSILDTIIGNSPTIATLIMVIYLLIKDRSREQRERLQKENKQDITEKEFRDYLIKTQSQLTTIIEENAEALNRNARAFELFSKMFEDHTKKKNSQL